MTINPSLAELVVMNAAKAAMVPFLERRALPFARSARKVCINRTQEGPHATLAVQVNINQISEGQLALNAPQEPRDLSPVVNPELYVKNVRQVHIHPTLEEAIVMLVRFTDTNLMLAALVALVVLPANVLMPKVQKRSANARNAKISDSFCRPSVSTKNSHIQLINRPTATSVNSLIRVGSF